MPYVLERARRDLAEGRPWEARRRLEGFVGSKGYDRDVLELLGDVCWRMHDVPAAGRFWFFCPTDSDVKRTAIEIFVREAKGRPESVVSRLPRKLRDARLDRYPIEVQDRLRALGVRWPADRKPATGSPAQRRGSPARDYLAFGALTLAGLFCLYCFSVGLAHLFEL